STEKGGNRLGTLNTVLTGGPGDWRLTGTKFYSTGTIFSDYTRVSAAVDGQDGRRFAVVATDAAGVRVDDDWDGFGQKLTGTGTSVFDDVPVEDAGVLDRVTGTAEAIHEAAFFQHVLLAVLAGIASASRPGAAAPVGRPSAPHCPARAARTRPSRRPPAASRRRPTPPRRRSCRPPACSTRGSRPRPPPVRIARTPQAPCPRPSRHRRSPSSTRR